MSGPKQREGIDHAEPSPKDYALEHPDRPGLLGHEPERYHGWDWAEDEQTEMRGVITEIYIGPPHPRLRMETEDGNWRVDLGNPRRTEEGDEVLIRGHRSRDDENVMKAVRATINDEHYTFYPERLED